MELLIKGSTELNKMFMALQRTASGLRRDFGEVENLQQSLRGARDFVAKASARIEESILSDLTLVRPAAGLLTPNVSRDGDGRDEKHGGQDHQNQKRQDDIEEALEKMPVHRECLPCRASTPDSRRACVILQH